MNKKILLCNLSYYPEVGGVENSIKSLKDAYIKNGYDVDLIVGTKNKSTIIEKSSNISYFQRNYFSSRIGFIINPILTIIQIIILLNKAKRKNYDICICRNQLLSTIGLLFFKDKLVYIAPGFAFMQQNTNNLGNNLKRRLSKAINEKLDYITLKYAKKIYVFSQNMAEQALHITPLCRKKLFITNPGVDIHRFIPYSLLNKDILSKNNNIKNKIIVCVGRLVKAKGFNYVINTIALLPEDYTCLIVGNGPEYDNLITLIKNLSLEDRVTIITDCNTPEKIYPLGFVFIMSSIYEPFGQTILEAMSCNLPIIAFSPSKDVITATKDICGNYATYVDLDCTALAQAILNTTSSSNSNSREYVKKNYSWERLSLELINELHLKNHDK
ncbi:TPA: glycosyltransferase [Providencia rettgeri]|nr:glycosyltransferase [Providencia rettgeri]